MKEIYITKIAQTEDKVKNLVYESSKLEIDIIASEKILDNLYEKLKSTSVLSPEYNKIQDNIVEIKKYIENCNNRKENIKQEIIKTKEQRDAIYKEGLDKAVQSNTYSQCSNDLKLMTDTFGPTGFSIAVSPTFFSDTGKQSDFKYSGVVAWLSGAIKAGDFQFIGVINYRNKEQIPDTDVKNTFYEQNSLTAGISTRYLFTPRIHANADVVYLHTRNTNVDTKKDIVRYSIGTDIKLFNGDFATPWLALSIGSEANNPSGNNVFVLSNLKWGLSSSPSFAPVNSSCKCTSEGSSKDLSGRPVV
ncbi:hypothetical protein GMSM_46750 [Geomonas sp. Red276]